MSKLCEICNKGSMLLTPRNKLRGKYNPTDKKRKYPNLQWVLLVSSKKRIKACAKCIKTMAKPKK
ncbi:MAG: 50S ribosomal protein L28 [Patescibacteria group bacterium]